MTSPSVTHPQYVVEFTVAGTKVSVVRDDAGSAVDALKECARLHGEAVLSPVGGGPLLIERTPSRVGGVS